MVPSGVGGYESGTHELAGVVVHSEQEGLLVLSGPPLMDGGIVLPEFAQAGAFPATARLGLALGQGDQRREVGAGISGNGSAVAVEGETSGQFIGHELVVGRPLQRQEAFQKQIHVGGPVRPGRAAGELGSEGGGLTQPAGAQPIEVSTADVEFLGRGGGVELARVEGFKGLVEEQGGKAVGDLMFFKGQLHPALARWAKLFVGLRYAPASSKPGPAGENCFPYGKPNDCLLLFPPAVSFCSRPDRKKPRLHPAQATAALAEATPAIPLAPTRVVRRPVPEGHHHHPAQAEWPGPPWIS